MPCRNQYLVTATGPDYITRPVAETDDPSAVYDLAEGFYTGRNWVQVWDRQTCTVVHQLISED